MAAAPGPEFAASLLSTLMPQVVSLSGKLVELQQQQVSHIVCSQSACTASVHVYVMQQILVASVTIQKEELLSGSEEWRQAKAVLDRIPGMCSHDQRFLEVRSNNLAGLSTEYQAKLARMHRAMAAGHAQLLRANKSALALRDRLEERDSETRARRAAEQAAYQSVSTSVAASGSTDLPQ